ncbi:MAG: SDR family oxidoreductase [Chloroflexi bacterium]|nr:SDR family oxidoreductase [Chloroflexota bacterium]
MTTARDGTYLVTGATGRTGSHVVRRLVREKARVRALVHTTPADNLPREGVQYVQGDYQDPDSLLRACEGVDWVIATVGAQAASRGLDLAEKVEYQGTVNLTNAAKAQGVRHLALVSVRAASAEWTFYPVYVAKARAEEHLRWSGLPYTILRPGGIIDTGGALFRGMADRVRKGEAITVYGTPDQPTVWVFLDELAEFCINAHLVRRAWHKTFDIGGPASPTRAELWGLIGRLAGAEPKVDYRPADEVVPLREAAERARDWPRAHQYAREEIAARFMQPAPDMGIYDRLFGVKQRDFERWLLGVLTTA